MIEDILKVHNITGDLEKLVKGEEVTIPEGKTEAEYKKELLDQHLKERDEVSLVRLNAVIEEKVTAKVKKKSEELYPSIVNPLMNRIKAKGEFSDDELKDKDPKEALELFFQRTDSKIEEVRQKSGGKNEDLVNEINQKSAKVVELTNLMDEMEQKHKVELEKTRQEEASRTSEYIHDKEFSEFVASVQPDLTVKGHNARVLLSENFKKYGYKTAVKDGRIVLLDLQGAEALSLDNNKKIVTIDDMKELAFEISKKENFYKTSHKKDPDDPNPDPGKKKHREKVSWE